MNAEPVSLTMLPFGLPSLGTLAPGRHQTHELKTEQRACDLQGGPPVLGLEALDGV
jgi:hypothetical protein